MKERARCGIIFVLEDNATLRANGPGPRAEGSTSLCEVPRYKSQKDLRYTPAVCDMCATRYALRGVGIYIISQPYVGYIAFERRENILRLR